MRGRKPRPTSAQIAEGDPRKKGVHKLAAKLASEPGATAGLPKCPRHLKGRARAAWTFWASELADMRIDKRPDGPMLEGACVNYARAVQADLILERDGLTVEDSIIADDGERIVLKIKKHPAVDISRAAWTQMRAFCGEFGLSPVSRTRLSIDRQDAAEVDLAKILSQPREPRTTAVN